MVRRLLIAVLILPLLTAGCASYQPGRADPPAATVFVAPVVNESFLPQASAIIGNRLRESFLKDNGMRLAAENEAATRLEVTLTAVDREGRARGLEVLELEDGSPRLTNDTGMARAFDVTLLANARLIDASTGAVLFEQEFDVDAQTLPSPYSMTEGDLERQMIPVLGRELARQIHDAVSSGWDMPTAQ